MRHLTRLEQLTTHLEILREQRRLLDNYIKQEEKEREEELQKVKRLEKSKGEQE